MNAEAAAETKEETQDERVARHALEKKALRPGRSYDALPERLLALLGCNLGASMNPDEGTPYERALFRYAAATTKAVAMALQGTEYVISNEDFDTQFTTEEAAIVLCGLSALLDEGPQLIEDVRDASEVQP